MLLELRNGSTFYQINVPAGARVEATDTGRPVLLLPGDGFVETWTWLPATQIVEAAKAGRHGLRLMGKSRGASSVKARASA